MRAVLLPITLLVAAIPAAAQPVVVSPAPGEVAVTLYRGNLGEESPRNPDWPQGYALISETRRVHLPAGRSVLRFEGVAEGMMPETAIVTGLPKAADEKNRDAQLLSPASLINAYLKRRVTVRRTNRATGKATVTEAVIEAGPGDGVLLTTADGVEALGCSGLPEAITYPGLPKDLSAKPTLSVIVDSPRESDVTLRLAYLSQGFAWSARYVVNLADDGTTADLLAWMTIRNGGSQGFAAARTQAVAGRLNKEDSAELPESSLPELKLTCWPMDITSTHPRHQWRRISSGGAEPMAVERDPSELVVTASRINRRDYVSNSPIMAISTATLEELGDLKLYRLPEPVDLMASGQKQVAMINRPRARFDRIYTAEFGGSVGAEGKIEGGTTAVLRAENRETVGLGVPLPKGEVAIFEARGGGAWLVGETGIDDRAVGEEVELLLGDSINVRYAVTRLTPTLDRWRYRVEASNAERTPVQFEIALPDNAKASDAQLIQHKGARKWRVTLPAGGTAGLDLAVPIEK